MTNDGINTLVYDAENHVTSSTSGSGSGTYTYDGNGQRVEKVGGGNTIVTIFLGNQVLAEYYNGAVPSSPTNEYIYAGNLRVAIIQSGTSTYYWHNDHLSPRVRTDSSGNIADQRGTFPFGETWYSPGSTAPWMFTTYYRDVETSGNDYAQARSYVGGLGRFSSPDPISGSTSDPQSLNRYSYVRNMPHWLSDPLGLTPSCNTAKNPDTSQSQDSKSGGGPLATDWVDPSEAEPQSAGQSPCDQDPWYYGGGSGGVSIDGGEGFSPGDGGWGLTGIGNAGNNALPGGGGTSWVWTPGDCVEVVGGDKTCEDGYYSLITLPGGGSGGGNSSWAWTFTKSFFTFAGGPGNVPTCAGQTLRDIADDVFNPFPSEPSAADLGKLAAAYGAGVQFNKTLTYAAGRGLTFPQKSRVFTAMLNDSKALAEEGGVGSIAVATSFSASYRTYTTSVAVRNGECAAAFPIF